MTIPHTPPDVQDAKTKAKAKARPYIPPPGRSHYYGQPAPKAAAVPWWMLGPAALQKQALEQATALYKPQLDELHSQQTEAQRQNAANLQAVQKLIQVVQGKARELGIPIAGAFDAAAHGDYGSSSLADAARESYAKQGEAYSGIGDTYAKAAGNAGEAEYLNVIQEGNKTSRDLLGEIAKLQAAIPGAAHDIYGELVSGQEKFRSQQAKDLAAQQKQLQWQYKVYSDSADRYSAATGIAYVVKTNAKGEFYLDVARDKSGKPLPANFQKQAQVSYFTANSGRYKYDPVTDTVTTLVAPAPKPPKQPTNTGPYYIDPKTGQPKLDPKYHLDANGNVVENTKPSKLPPKTAMGKWNKLTPTKRYETEKKAAQTIEQWTTEPWRRLPSRDLKKILDAFNKQKIKVDGKTIFITPADVPKLNGAQLERVGLADVKVADNPQILYKQLIRMYRVPARVAWEWVRRVYPNFGPDYFH